MPDTSPEALAGEVLAAGQRLTNAMQESLASHLELMAAIGDLLGLPALAGLRAAAEELRAQIGTPGDPLAVLLAGLPAGEVPKA